MSNVRKNIDYRPRIKNERNLTSRLGEERIAPSSRIGLPLLNDTRPAPCSNGVEFDSAQQYILYSHTI